MISTSLLATALFEIAKTLAEKGVVDPAMEKGLSPITKWITGGFDRKKAEEELQKAFMEAIKSAGAPSSGDDNVAKWLKGMGLDRLQEKKNHLLRMKVAQSIIEHTDPQLPPPDDLVMLLRWPRDQKVELSKLLYNIRRSLSKFDQWQPLIAYADSAAEQGMLKTIISRITDFSNLMVWADSGTALRVVIEKMGLSQGDVANIERNYRDELVRELYWHSFRGIVQIKQDLRLPLSNIYLDLSVVELRSKEEQEKYHLKMLELNQEERINLEEKHDALHISSILSKEKKLVILGDPGSGKTISLRYIALMLGYGGSSKDLGLNEPLIPLIIRLSDFARELENRPRLSLENYLVNYIQQAYSSSDRLGEFLRLLIEQGKCMLLLDGLDEVDFNFRMGKVSHESVIQAVQKFAYIRCNENCGNRMIVTSRIEGYWNDPLLDFKHIQLKSLTVPDEVESFLMQWYTAHELAFDRNLDLDIAESRALERVTELMPKILSTASVRRLATNPLLLTILALINENVGRLPNRRIKLYEIAAQTLIECWRQLQVGLPDNLIAEFGEDMVIRVMAPLAYWMHDNYPGGTASFEEISEELEKILENEGFEKESKDLTNRFLYHARFQTGLLTERSLNQFGFFHLTFEEYLTARQIARQREDERRRMLKLHWYDPRWQEVILLTAGQLGIAESKTDDVSVFIEDLLKMEPEKDEQIGKPAVLAGRALSDIGSRSVTVQTRRWIEQALHDAAKDLNPETHKPSTSKLIPIATRASAAELLDELSFTPDDLFDFMKVGDIWMGKYPVTNIQYQRFIDSADYMDPELWQSFPMFDETCSLLDENWGTKGLEWLKCFLPDIEDKKSHIILPGFWKDNKLGILHKNMPVVGISWYEANAYCKWLNRHWTELQESRSDILKPTSVRLPTLKEWEFAAGGVNPTERYAWDKPGEKTTNLDEILRRTNIRENKLGFTTPVWMFPLGISPNNVMDMTGNVWEWQANYSHKEKDYISLHGGSWNVNREFSLVSYHFYFRPFDRSSSVGFRLIIQ